MVVAVGIYLLFNAGRSSAHGWGVAMSTDTAFALGLLALVGPRFPDRLRAFMLTVVVVDDVLALVVIATVYAEDVSALGASGSRRACSLRCSWYALFGVRVPLVCVGVRRWRSGWRCSSRVWSRSWSGSCSAS